MLYQKTLKKKNPNEIKGKKTFDQSNWEKTNINLLFKAVATWKPKIISDLQAFWASNGLIF